MTLRIELAPFKLAHLCRLFYDAPSMMYGAMMTIRRYIRLMCSSDTFEWYVRVVSFKWYLSDIFQRYLQMIPSTFEWYPFVFFAIFAAVCPAGAFLVLLRKPSAHSEMPLKSLNKITNTLANRIFQTLLALASLENVLSRSIAPCNNKIRWC